MPQFGDFLSRFRPVGAPGAASRVAVPADRAAELSAELEPVLAMLAATEAECARVITEAEQAAGGIGEDARARADAIAADGLARARAAHDGAANEVLAAARARAAQVERSAAESARARSGPGEDEARALIREAVGRVSAMPGGGQGR